MKGKVMKKLFLLLSFPLMLSLAKKPHELIGYAEFERAGYDIEQEVDGYWIPAQAHADQYEPEFERAGYNVEQDVAGYWVSTETYDDFIEDGYYGSALAEAVAELPEYDYYEGEGYYGSDLAEDATEGPEYDYYEEAYY